MAQQINPVELSFKAHLAAEEMARRANYAAYRAYYDGDHPTQLTERQRRYLELKTGQTFCGNYCQVVVDALSERLNVTGFTCEQEALQDMIGQWWATNTMDETQIETHLCAARDGDTYIMIDWDGEQGVPRFVHHLASDGAAGVHIHYADGGRSIMYASKRWVVEEGEGAGKVRRLNLYWPDRVEKYQSNEDNEQGNWKPFKDEGDTAWPLPWLDRQGKPLGVPIVHFKNAAAGHVYGLSELGAVLPLQDALNKSLIDYIAAADTTAFQMLFANFDPGSMTIAPGVILWSEKDGAAMNALPASDMASLKGLIDTFVIQIAGVSRTPQYYFQGMGTPPSGESLKAQETGLVSKAKNRQVTWGNAWERVLYQAFKQASTFGATPMEPGVISCQWADAETRNELMHLQALEVKQRLGVPEEQLWSEAGYNAADIAKMQKMKETATSKQETLGSMLLKQFERPGQGTEQAATEQEAALA